MNAPLTRNEVIKQHVLDLIASGELTAGDRVPSENELVKAFGVSRMTANRALRELTGEGHIVRRAGLGTFVADSRVRGEPIKVSSIREEVESRGEAWSAEVLTAGEIRANAALAETFGIEPGDALIHLMILHRADGVPVELEDRAVNPGVVPGCLERDFTRETTRDYLLAAAPLLRAEHVVRAVLPSEAEARLLELDEDACLLLERKSWSGGRVASVARLLYPGSRYEMRSNFENE